MQKHNLGGFSIIIAALGLFVAASAQAKPVAALPNVTTPTFEAGNARPIQGWVDFCRRRPAECAVDRSEPAVLKLDTKTWRAIVTVNKAVNAEIVPLTDMEHLGIPDYWDFPINGIGDCEDYQLLKRKRLAELGIPRRAMRMTVVIDERDEGHAVLMIRTDRGDLILDNKTDAVLPWHQTGYVYVKRESQDKIGWTSLGHATSPVVTANR